MSVFSQFLQGGGLDLMPLLTGKTVEGHMATTNPLHQSFGAGSSHHASAAEGTAGRFGLLPSQIMGALVEVAEGIGNPKGFMGHMQDVDTQRDIIANLIGGIEGTPGMPEKTKAALLNALVPILQGEFAQQREMPGLATGLRTALGGGK